MEWFRRQQRIVQAALGCGGALMICTTLSCIAAIGMALVAPDSEEDALAEAAVEATATFTPTAGVAVASPSALPTNTTVSATFTATPELPAVATAAPTETPIPPTSTVVPPTPTALPPTATATPAVSQVEIDYIAAITDQSDTFVESMTRTGDLFGDARIFDQDWIIGVAVEFATWESLYNDAVALQVPEGYETFHAKWLESLGLLVDAADELTYGIDNFDSTAINEGARLIEEANTALVEALDLFEDASS